MLTIPTIDWVAKLGANRSKLASFSIAKYGAQTGNDWQWFADAGNGVRTNGQYVTGNDPNDANVPSNSTFQQGWVQHLVGRWGTTANGGLRYYILDNEPSIWHSTHRDVRPTGATMDEIRSKMLDYAGEDQGGRSVARSSSDRRSGAGAAISSAATTSSTAARTAGARCPIATITAARTTCPGCSTQLRQDNAATGERLLDVFTVHYYPQGGEFSDDVSSAMQLRRNRSTRSLWDPDLRRRDLDQRHACS